MASELTAPGLIASMEALSVSTPSEPRTWPSKGLHDEPLALLLLSLPNVVIAGGFVLVKELPDLTNTEGADIDVWIYGMSHEGRTETGNAAKKMILEFDPDARCSDVGSSVINVYSVPAGRKMQLIFVHCSTSWAVVERFDMEACMAFYQKTADGSVSCSAKSGALKAWKTRVITAASCKGGVADTRRLTKMMSRGFRIAVPDFVPVSSEELAMFQDRSSFFEERSLRDWCVGNMQAFDSPSQRGIIMY